MALSANSINNIPAVLQKSARAGVALTNEILKNPETKAFVINTLKALAVTAVAKRQQIASSSYVTSTSTSSTTRQPQQQSQYETHRREEVTINDHKYSGKTLRRILTGLVTAVFAAMLYSRKEDIKQYVRQVVDELSLDSVLTALSSIMVAFLKFLQTVKNVAVTKMKEVLARTNVKIPKA